MRMRCVHHIDCYAWGLKIDRFIENNGPALFETAISQIIIFYKRNNNDYYEIYCFKLKSRV